MAIAGTKTSAMALEWAMSNLVKNPHVLKKAREMLDAQVGQDRLMEESDFSKLPYLQNIINETFRLNPTNPLLVPHYSSSDCTIGGYHVPRGTMVLANAWAIQRDPTLWEDPSSFRPERFDDVQANSLTYKLMPFGAGRRACPGEPLALRVITLTLGTLIQCFDWETISGEEISMKENIAISMSRAVPLELNCKSRPHLISKILA
ncbi:hypothetical protein Tsubulata_011891 [Turnera subulata]|uniref:Cytochrome P450 n=1 Tax=Turnera subulata TaxID=218843 RepID=A0A9Q0GBN5_9ROSI|nr:hypothetical protein Tsubulata_011891 [Turnera subulata]